MATLWSLSTLTKPFKWNRKGENKIRDSYGAYEQWKKQKQIHSASFKARLSFHVLENFDYTSMGVTSW